MKKVLIAILIFIGAAMLLVLPGIGIKNSAITQEENIAAEKSNITIQVDKRNEKMSILIDSIKSYQDYEKAVVDQIAGKADDAKNCLSSGDYEGAKTIITDLVKLYPDLKSANHYEQYNTEIIACENKIERYETSYNDLIKEYKSFVRKFPNSLYLSIFGYNVATFELLDYTEKNNNTELPSFGD